MRTVLFVVSVLFLMSCQDKFLGKDPENTPRSNFESLWKTLDEKYSFFSYKGVDWDDVYRRYAPQINDFMNDEQLFVVLSEMLSELHDSHVNLETPVHKSSYERIFASSPINYDDRVVNTVYLRNNYEFTGPFKHQIIASGKIGYVRYASFEDEVTSSSIEYVISRFKDLNGIIIDVRSNGGGSISNVFTLCSHFTDETRFVYTSYLKKGPGHEDFDAPNNVSIAPSANPFTKKVCVLTNRGSYSATSFFVLAMRNFPNVTIVGDTTGGGLGAPAGAELPNGWAYRYSCSKTISPEGENLENGIPPDVEVNLSATDSQRNVDSIIERAKRIILGN